MREIVLSVRHQYEDIILILGGCKLIQQYSAAENISVPPSAYIDCARETRSSSGVLKSMKVPTALLKVATARFSSEFFR